MRIACIGGGPGGLYAALLLKKRDSTREVVVIDRNPPGATYGWGVVFSDETLNFLEENDRESYSAIAEDFVHWEAIDVHYRGTLIHSGGHAFSGLSRRRLLNILQRRCLDLGVELHLNQEAELASLESSHDLIIAADGVNSRARHTRANAFKPSFDVHRSKYIWLGARMHLDAFTFDFQQTSWGMFQAHAYPFEPELATFIVECNEDVWRAAGLERATEADNIAFAEHVFAGILAGAPLLSNRSTWLSFVTMRNETWSDGNIVLLGDAAHTAHFSIGSGTKIAMEDAIALSNVLEVGRDVRTALVDYEELRQPVVDRLQQAARDSSLWFEHVQRYAGFDPVQFGFSLLTRSKRITYENLRLRDATFARRVDAWFHSRAEGGVLQTASAAPVPLANTLRLRSLALDNRLAAAAIDIRGALDGVPSVARFPLSAYGFTTIDPVATILTEPVAVSAEGRVTPASPGLYSHAAVDAWQTIVAGARQRTPAAICLRLSHAGPRGATRSHEEGVDFPLSEGAWPLLAASALPYSPYSATPRAMEPEDMVRIRDAFTQATKCALEIGVDMLELDFGHGYLLGTFLSPLTNHRKDEFGGDVTGRLRYPLEILTAVRGAWPDDRPISVAFSVTDWARGGINLDDAADIATAFRQHGCDLIHVVTGQTVFNANPLYGRNWEAPFGDAIRNDAHIPVLLGGNIQSEDDANTLLAAGRADLCLIAPLHAAATASP